jgi:hypothetical protein
MNSNQLQSKYQSDEEYDESRKAISWFNSWGKEGSLWVYDIPGAGPRQITGREVLELYRQHHSRCKH